MYGRPYIRPNYFYYYGVPRVFINPPIVIHNGWDGYYHEDCEYCNEGYCTYHRFYDERLYDNYYNQRYYDNGGNYDNNVPYDRNYDDTYQR